jgi:putative membrane protein insertion efficiency factor
MDNALYCCYFASTMKWLTQCIVSLLLGVIKIYQLFISPLMGPSKCRYVPTCSEYARIALQQYGVFKGMWLSVKRISRCAPWGGHGYDPVP